MVKYAAAATLLLSACALHPDDTRGTIPENLDPLVGNWEALDGSGPVTFHNGTPGRFEHPAGVLPSGTQWTREGDELLVTIEGGQDGPETVQADFEADFQIVHLKWRTDAGVGRADLVRPDGGAP